MQLLLQNVQDLSSAVQSLLKTIDTVSLERYNDGGYINGAQYKFPLWRQKKAGRPRMSSVALRKKELEGSGELICCLNPLHDVMS